MARASHSSTTFVKGVALQAARPVNGRGQDAPMPAKKTRFGYFFRQQPSDRLEESSKTVSNLKGLGELMREPAGGGKDSPIPSVYTYFGQFIAHDLTFDALGKHIQLTEDIEPMEVELVESICNHRTGHLDLDCVYGPDLADGSPFPLPRHEERKDEFKLGFAVGSTHSMPDGDLPRGDRPPYTAIIGDRRNDENLPLSQLHVAFLKAHNKLVRSGLKFDQAKKLLKRRYQNLVIRDFLPRLVHKEDLKEAADKRKAEKRKAANETKLYSPQENDLFIPIEFTAAAFRFGHSMIRSRYLLNDRRGSVPLRQLFMRSALSGYYQLLPDWVIDWTNFVENGANKARTLSPQLVEPLGVLAITDSLRFNLAVHDLLRGYVLGLPTGQALARAMDIKPLTEAEVLESAVSAEQRQLLKDSGFAATTPLWFYMFAEAQHKRGGNFLGPVCGQLIAWVLEELAHQSNYGDDEPWNDTLGKRETFNLTEFLKSTV